MMRILKNPNLFWGGEVMQKTYISDDAQRLHEVQEPYRSYTIHALKKSHLHSISHAHMPMGKSEHEEYTHAPVIAEVTLRRRERSSENIEREGRTKLVRCHAIF